MTAYGTLATKKEGQSRSALLSSEACREHAGENAQQHQCATEQNSVMAGFHCLTGEAESGGTGGQISGLFAAGHRAPPHNLIGMIPIGIFRGCLP